MNPKEGILNAMCGDVKLVGRVRGSEVFGFGDEMKRKRGGRNCKDPHRED